MRERGARRSGAIAAVGTAMVCLALAGCAAAPGTASGPVADWTAAPLAVETRSWGDRIGYYRVEPSGAAELWTFTQRPKGTFRDIDVAKFRGHVPPEMLARFRAAFAPYATGRLKAPRCAEAIHDAPGTEARWGAVGDPSAQWSFYLGCIDKRSQAYAQKPLTILEDLRRAIVAEPAPFEVEHWPKPSI